MSAAASDEEPFNQQPVEQLGHTGLTYLTIYMYWTAVEGSGIDSLEQAIEEDVGIWGFPPQWGLRRLLRTNMQGTGRWEDMQENLVGIAAEDVAGAIEEERVQVFTSYVSNLVSPPGWMVEVDSRHDIKAIDVGDWYWEGVDASPASNVDGVTESGYEQDLGADEIHAWTEGFNVYFSPDVPADAVYEILDVSNNHWEEAREALPAYPDHSDPEAMTASFPDFTPVHAGAADWLKENDAWNDSWDDGGEM